MPLGGEEGAYRIALHPGASSLPPPPALPVLYSYLAAAALCASRHAQNYPGRVAQLAEHSTLNRQVEGSIPSASTSIPSSLQKRRRIVRKFTNEWLRILAKSLTHSESVLRNPRLRDGTSNPSDRR